MAPKPPICAIACLVFAVGAGFVLAPHAEYREVSIGEVVKEFFTVIVADEGHCFTTSACRSEQERCRTSATL